jgi:uncharacterized coiled-coil protein SlyX
MRRNRPPALVSMWMLDVFCCALGCVTLLWLLKTREAGQISDEASQASALVAETRGKLEDSEKESALRLANAQKLAADIDTLNKQLALMRQERDENARNLALVEEDLAKTKKDLVVAATLADTLEKTLKGLTSKLTASDEEMAKKRGELENLTKQLELAKKQTADLDVLVRDKEKARVEFESKLKESDRKLDEVTRSAGDMAKMQARIDALEKDLKVEKTKLDAANVTIVDLQGTKAKLADKVDKLQVESENRFAGIAMTGKNVVFLIDMSGSMERVEENQMDPKKWGTVRDTVCKVMRTLPDIDKFQVILFSNRVTHLLEAGDWIKFEREKSIDRVHKALTGVKPTGDTNMYIGLEETFRYRDKGLDTVYFFSDGLPTSGPGLPAGSAPANDPERSAILARHVRQTLNTNWNRADGMRPKVRINSVGFFFESPDVGAFLWALSRENDGSFVGMSKP